LPSTTSTAAPAGITDLFALKTTSNITAAAVQQYPAHPQHLGSQTDIGGLVLNGVGAVAPVVSANLVFGASLCAIPLFPMPHSCAKGLSM
jgi:hypothetical protein